MWGLAFQSHIGNACIKQNFKRWPWWPCLTRSLFIKVPVPSQETDRSCICVFWCIDFAYLYDFVTRLLKCSDSVVFYSSICCFRSVNFERTCWMLFPFSLNIKVKCLTHQFLVSYVISNYAWLSYFATYNWSNCWFHMKNLSDLYSTIIRDDKVHRNWQKLVNYISDNNWFLISL